MYILNQLTVNHKILLINVLIVEEKKLRRDY